MPRTASTKKKRTTKKRAPRKTSPTVEKLLVENFVSLQKAITKMTEQFSSLSARFDNLLQLFEVSAKAMAHKDYGEEEKEEATKKMLEKIDQLSEQNKIIARGLTLLHNHPVEKEVSWENQERNFNRPPMGYKPSINPTPKHPMKMAKASQNLPQNMNPKPAMKKNPTPNQKPSANMNLRGYQPSS